MRASVHWTIIDYPGSSLRHMFGSVWLPVVPAKKRSESTSADVRRLLQALDPSDLGRHIYTVQLNIGIVLLMIFLLQKA